MSEPWMMRAACRLDPSRMWDDERVLEAKQLCSVCPVLAECAGWEASLAEFVPGVIAGRDDEERANARRRCARCRKAIAPTRASSYCRPCKAAVEAARRQTYEEGGYGRKTCPWCHIVFDVVHGNARFCVDDHRVRYYRAQAAARRQGHLPSSSVRVLESQYG